MRWLALALLPLLATPAAAQHWNEAGPGRDLLGSATTELDGFRRRAPGTAAAGAGLPGTSAQPARGPIPMLDWVPPPMTAAPAPPARPRSPPPAPRRTEDRPAPLPVASDEDAAIRRSLAARERELDRLRQLLEEDRARYERSRQAAPR